MDAAALMAELASRDVRIWLEDGRLKCSAPPGALDGPLRAALAANKDDVLQRLQRARALESEPSNIVPLKSEGRRTPLFVLSGHGGDVYYLLALVRHLADDRPVLSVQPPGLDGGEPLTTVEALARYEVEQIRQRQPRGPYLIAGHCAGGTLAFEAGRQLVAAGETVALLALIGSPYPTAFSPFHQRLYRWSQHLKALSSGALADRWSYVSSRIHRRIDPASGGTASMPVLPESRQRVEAATMAAVRRHKPGQYPGRLDLIVTADNWHLTSRWIAHADTVCEHRIDGHTINDLLLGPDVGLLAATLQQRLSTVPV